MDECSNGPRMACARARAASRAAHARVALASAHCRATAAAGHSADRSGSSAGLPVAAPARALQHPWLWRRCWQPSAQPFPSRLPAAASAPVARVARRRRPLPLAAGCRCRTCRLRQRDDASNKKANAARQRPEPNVRAMRRSCRRWARAISSGRGVPAASRKHRAGVRHKSGVRTFG